jgi:hypothetical protein
MICGAAMQKALRTLLVFALISSTTDASTESPRTFILLFEPTETDSTASNCDPTLQLCAALLASPAGRIPWGLVVIGTFTGIYLVAHPSAVHRLDDVDLGPLLTHIWRKKRSRGTLSYTMDGNVFLATLAAFSKHNCNDEDPIDEKVSISATGVRKRVQGRIDSRLLEASVHWAVGRLRGTGRTITTLKKSVQQVFIDNGWGIPDPCWEDFIPPPKGKRRR